MTLPCGYTLCKGCIPDLYDGRFRTYSTGIYKPQGFRCPLPACANEHAIAECGRDIVVNEILDIVRNSLKEYVEAGESLKLQLEVTQMGKSTSSTGHSSLEEALPPISLPGGRIAAAYYMAQTGNLPFNSEISFSARSPEVMEAVDKLDSALLEDLREKTMPELVCHLCSALFLDPFTTFCGHTVCRDCIHRIQDYGSRCSLCKSYLHLPPSATAADAPSNLLLGKLLSSLFPKELAAREQMAKSDKIDPDLDTSLLIFMACLPHNPQFLIIVEPRIRLMMRRAIRSGRMEFGMVMPNPGRDPPFYEYGTMLHIENHVLYKEGRVVVECTGMYRFRVLRHGIKDGYAVGKIERIEDISTPDQQAIEAAETSSFHQLKPSSSDIFARLRLPVSPTSEIQLSDLDALTTEQLIEYGTTFAKYKQLISAPWRRECVRQSYGPCPDDPELFPWWFASVTHISHAEKYKMILTTSARQRLKMCAHHILEHERRIWCLYSIPLNAPTASR
jgi:hypothetical protein